MLQKLKKIILRWLLCGADGRTITWLAKFLGCMDNQIFLPMVLRYLSINQSFKRCKKTVRYPNMSLARVSGPRKRLGERRFCRGEEGGGRGRFSPCAVSPVRVSLSPFPQHVNLILILTCLATCIPESGWFCLWNPESWALESRILLPESRIPLAIEIWNLSSTEKESGIRNPESKTVLVSLTRGDMRQYMVSLIFPTVIIN